MKCDSCIKGFCDKSSSKRGRRKCNDFEEKPKLNIEDVKYLFTDIGGGWCYISDLYIITKDDKVYHTDKFSEGDLLNCYPEYICDLYPKDLRNCCISTKTSFTNGVCTKERKYLFDLLNSDGKVDFEDFRFRSSTIMDGTVVTLYKNVDNKLEKIVSQSYDGDDMPAVQYVITLSNMMG